jgi:xanthine/CO dehydrogenase XdhC/CoxF family maturation factor
VLHYNLHGDLGQGLDMICGGDMDLLVHVLSPSSEERPLYEQPMQNGGDRAALRRQETQLELRYLMGTGPSSALRWKDAGDRRALGAGGRGQGPRAPGLADGVAQPSTGPRAALVRAPIFLAATASQANVGVPVSAPVVAADRPGLAQVGLLLAVLGNALPRGGAVASTPILSNAMGDQAASRHGL